MTFEFITKAVVLACPVFFLLALVASVFVPDRLISKRDNDAEKFITALWSLAFLWALVPVTLVLSAAHKGDIGAITLSSIETIFAEAAAGLTGVLSVTDLAIYTIAGFTWTVVHFWLYARRLGLKYVMERDLWLQTKNLKSLEGLTQEQRASFTSEVVQKVKESMLYDGDFPLRTLQQKRFFVANLTFWPATLLFYVIGDFAVDVARRVWFSLRKRIHRYWEAAMSEYIADGALCEAFQTKLDKERQDKLDAARREEEARANSGEARPFMPGLSLSKNS